MDYVATSFTGMIQSCLYALHLNTDFFATESGYIPLVSFEPEATLPTFCVLGWPYTSHPPASKVEPQQKTCTYRVPKINPCLGFHRVLRPHPSPHLTFYPCA